jgi:hypothetical protein
MFTAILICSDGVCDHSDEFIGELEAADAVLCEGCGCLMQVVGIESADQPAAVISLAAHRTRRSKASRRLAA